jgi:hypothetical protein
VSEIRGDFREVLESCHVEPVPAFQSRRVLMIAHRSDIDERDLSATSPMERVRCGGAASSQEASTIYQLGRRDCS